MEGESIAFCNEPRNMESEKLSIHKRRVSGKSYETRSGNVIPEKPLPPKQKKLPTMEDVAGNKAASSSHSIPPEGLASEGEISSDIVGKAKVDMETSECVLKRDTDAEDLVDPNFLPIKTEPDFGSTSRENVQEDNLAVTQNTEGMTDVFQDMVSSECAVKGNTDDSEELLVEPLFVPVKVEPDFESLEESFESMEDSEELYEKMHRESHLEYCSTSSGLEIPLSSTQSSSVEEGNSCSSKPRSVRVRRSLGQESFAVATCSTAGETMDEEEVYYRDLSDGRGEEGDQYFSRPTVIAHTRGNAEEGGFQRSRYGKALDLSRRGRSNMSERPVKCSLCGESFAHSGNLTLHMRIHTGERPFLCNACGKAFKRSDHLTLHMRIHTGEKPFKCSQCDRSFTQSSAFTMHMRTHTGERPFECSECGKTFKRSNELTSHIRSHTGEKPFKCSQCEKSFMQSSDLTRHMRVHTGERPFTCSLCGKCFRTSGNLSSHRRDVHKVSAS